MNRVSIHTPRTFSSPTAGKLMLSAMAWNVPVCLYRGSDQQNGNTFGLGRTEQDL